MTNKSQGLRRTRRLEEEAVAAGLVGHISVILLVRRHNEDLLLLIKTDRVFAFLGAFARLEHAFVIARLVAELRQFFPLRLVHLSSPKRTSLCS